MKKVASKADFEPRIRRPAEEIKAYILKETLALIKEVGWSGVSFQKIAARCETTAPNVVYHFASKEILMAELLKVISVNNYRIVDQAMKPELNALKRLVLHFQKNLEWSHQFPQEAYVVMQIYMEAGHNKEFKELFLSMLNRAEERIEAYLHAGQREKIFKLSHSPRILSQIIHSLLIGEFMKSAGHRLTKREALDAKETEAILKSLVGYQSKSSGIG